MLKANNYLIWFTIYNEFFFHPQIGCFFIYWLFVIEKKTICVKRRTRREGKRERKRQTAYLNYIYVRHGYEVKKITSTLLGLAWLRLAFQRFYLALCFDINNAILSGIVDTGDYVWACLHIAHTHSYRGTETIQIHNHLTMIVLCLGTLSCIEFIQI